MAAIWPTHHGGLIAILPHPAMVVISSHLPWRPHRPTHHGGHIAISHPPLSTSWRSYCHIAPPPPPTSWRSYCHIVPRLPPHGGHGPILYPRSPPHTCIAISSRSKQSCDPHAGCTHQMSPRRVLPARALCDREID